MENKVNSKSIEAIKEVLRNYLKEKGLRNTPERYTILEEIYNYDKHFNVDDLYLLMLQKKYHIRFSPAASGVCADIAATKSSHVTACPSCRRKYSPRPARKAARPTSVWIMRTTSAPFSYTVAV